jgi:GT2 family glycosyltransferase
VTIRIAAVVVTYNRKVLLARCLQALAAQTRRPDVIVLVDNCSTDGTREMLAEAGWLDRYDLALLSLPDNTGGAGGFAAGISHAAAMGVDWIWVMDDDAVPHPDALEALLAIPLDPANLYGSVAVSGEQLSWPMLPIDPPGADRIHLSSQLPDLTDVLFIPFLGLMVSPGMVEAIGVPDAGFFIAVDDVDYCLRARARGARILLAGRSHIEHPASDADQLRFPWGTFHTLRLVPWKRYYDVRNRIFVARNHYGLRLYYQTIPGSFLRLLAALLHEPNRMEQLRAFTAGMIDGLLGRKGRRHEAWGIRP